MNGFWKGVSFTIILFFCLVFVYNFLNRNKVSQIDNSSYNEQVDRYNKYLEDQDNRNIEYYKKAEATIIEVNEINDKSMKNQDRFERLLERWEKQADKMDELLLKIENKNL